MQLNFKNQFGTLSLELVSGVLHVDGIFGSDIPNKHKFGLDTAEKVALITENRRIQIGGFGTTDCYVIVHESSSLAAIARIASMDYVGGNPQQEIQRAKQNPILE